MGNREINVAVISHRNGALPNAIGGGARRSASLGLPVAVALALAACGATRQRAVSRRPGVLVEHTAGACRPTALMQIDNPSACRVQLVARNDAGEAIGATGWIAAGTSRPRFDLPQQFDWVVLEVDPGCASPIASVRYAAAASVCEAGDASRR